MLIGGGLTNRPFLKVMPAVRLSWRDRPREETHVTSLDEYRYWLTKAESARELADSYVERAYMADRVALTPPDEDENDQADEELDASEFDDSDDEELDDTEEEDDQTHRLRMLALSMNMSAGPEGTPWEVTPRARTLSDQELADETNKATAGTGRPPLQALVNASANTSADSERQQRLLALSAAVAQQQGTSLENVRQRAIDGDREAQMQLAQIYNAASARAIAAASTGNRPPISQGVATPWKQGTNY